MSDVTSRRSTVCEGLYPAISGNTISGNSLFSVAGNQLPYDVLPDIWFVTLSRTKVTVWISSCFEPFGKMIVTLRFTSFVSVSLACAT